MPLPIIVEDETPESNSLSQDKLAVYSVIVVAIVIVASIWGSMFLVGKLVQLEEQLLEDELKEMPPPTWPIPSTVVDDIETLADFGYRKIDTVAHANAGDFIQFRFEDLGYEVEIQNFTTELCEDCRNYVATIEGENPDSWILIGGHYDAIC